MIKKTLVLVDGSSFLYRAFHAVPPLSNQAGEPTNAIFGVSNMLRKLMSDYATDYMAVVFDAGGKTFRHELSVDYKATRPPMPDDLRCQIEPLKTLIQTMGLPFIALEGIEADDILGTLTKMATQQDFDVVIATGDKDMAQLVCESVLLDDTMSKTRLDIQGVIDKYGVKPNQIVDYLALMGDSSDNIAGVPKVGPKTAAKWLDDYGTLENLIEKSTEIKGKIGDNLRTHLKNLPLAKQLTTINCDLEMDYTIDDLKTQPIDIEALKKLLTHLEFSAWLKSLNSKTTKIELPEKTESVKNPLNVEIILTQTQLETWLEKLARADLFSIDTETTSLDYSKAEIVGLSFAVEAGFGAYLPLKHDYPNAPKQLDRETILETLRPLLENPTPLKCGQNIKYDIHVFANHGIDLQGVQHDTMLASYVLNSTGKHNMDDLAQTYLGVKTIRYEDIAGKGAKQLPFSQIAIDVAAPYAAEDAEVTLKLQKQLLETLRTEEKLHTLYTTLEMPLLFVLTKMEKNGVLIDSQMLSEYSLELAGQLIFLEQKAHELAGHTFNLGSPKQIQELFYEQLKLPILKKTPTGQPSTDESVLQELAADYELPKILLEHRGLSKLKSTYTDKLPQQINTKTGRVHTSYHQAVTVTGRLSSSEPNLQNIPIRNEQGRRIRQAFIARNNYKMVAADYSQIELRIMAHLSGDENLINAFNSGQDIHKATAAEVFNQPLENVSSELRRSAKAINFGLIYGMSGFGLAKQLSISRTQAQSYIDSYFARYPAVKKYMDNIRIEAKELGYVETLWGRRLYVPDIHSRNNALKKYAERTAINAPMQGTAADIIKRAMIDVDAYLTKNHPDVFMIMQVHDELVFEIPETKVEICIPDIQKLMCDVITLRVPLQVDVGIGNNWDEAH